MPSIAITAGAAEPAAPCPHKAGTAPRLGADGKATDLGKPELDGGSKFLGCQRGMLTIKIEGGEAERKAEKERNGALIRRFATLLGEVVGIFAQ